MAASQAPLVGVQVVTKAFQSQHDPLNASDLGAAWLVLKVTAAQPFAAPLQEQLPIPYADSAAAQAACCDATFSPWPGVHSQASARQLCVQPSKYDGARALLHALLRVC